MKVLTKEAKKDREDFYNKFGDSGECSCHINPPCSFCTHPGNPVNQEEDPECWIEVPDENLMNNKFSTNATQNTEQMDSK